MWLLKQVKSVAIKLVASFTRMTIVIKYRSSNVYEVEFGVSLFTHVVPTVFLLVPRGSSFSYGVPRGSPCPTAFLSTHDRIYSSHGIRSLTKRENKFSLRQIECLNNYVNICC